MSITTSQDVCPANGARLNYLFEQYQQSPTTASEASFFAELLNYAERIVTDFAKQESVPVDSVKDAIQEACLKVFKPSKPFGDKSKFSTWVFTIVRNAFYDELRKDFRRKEQALSEGIETTGKEARSNTDSDSPVDVLTDDAVSLLTKLEISTEEDRRILQLDRQRLEQSLSNEDYEIFQRYLEGESASETAKRLRVKTKHVYNRRQVIKNRALQVRKSVPIARTISAKDAEDLAQGSRRAQEFVNEFQRLEKERWSKLTVTRPWHSETQVFTVENFTVFGSFEPDKRTAVGYFVDRHTRIRLPNRPTVVWCRGQGVFHPEYGYGAIAQELDEKWASVRFRSSVRVVPKSSLRSASELQPKPLSAQRVNATQSETVPEWVSKIPGLERQSIGEGFSLPT